MPTIPPRPAFPAFNDPNPGIDPAVFDVAIPISQIMNILGAHGGCTPAFFTQLYAGSGQGTVTLSSTDNNRGSLKVVGASWIDFVFDQTWNFNNPNATHDWRPIGIVFNGAKGGRGDNNIPVQNIALFPPGLVRRGAPARLGSTLRIYDACAVTTGPVSYSLFVQYSDNQVAMIDPDIVNENET